MQHKLFKELLNGFEATKLLLADSQHEESYVLREHAKKK